MAENNIRISKVLKEFNIGLSTLVDFLTKKGVEVESNPNSKISTDAYDLVISEFAPDRKLKDQSKEVLPPKQAAKEAAKKNVKEVEEEEEEIEVKEIIITDNTAAEPVIDIATPRVKGKIDLDALTKKKTDKKVEKEEKKKEEEKVEAIVENPVEPIEEKVEETKIEVEETPKEKIEDVTISEPEKPEEKIETPKTSGPKVIGTINLADSKKAKQTKHNKHDKNKKHKPEVKVEEKKPAPAPKPQEPTTVGGFLNIGESETKKREGAEFIKTEVEKLEGPKLAQTEKIDLSQFEKKKPESQGNKKKKRERIKKSKEKVDIEREAKNAKPNQQSGKNNDQAKNKDNKKKKRDFPKPPVRREVDDDEVQRQVKETLARLTASGHKTKSSKYRRDKRDAASEKMIEQQEQQMLESKVLKVTEFVTANDLANMMKMPVTKVIEACMNLDLMVSINQRLDAEALVLVAEEFGYKVEFVSAGVQDVIDEEEDRTEDLISRPPIITVMGHVDHGKTSLLDNIRNANVIAGEAGGITQHIGAYNVKLQSGRHITFLDTPGHEAFTAMRARGAKITDLAIIIIAADDAVMPQTVEAINHAKSAGVPMVFAINKIDKDGANPDKIKEQLANMNLLVEDWGGSYQCQEIAAKKGIGVEQLLEKVLLETDMLELKANPKRRAKGSVIESSLDKGRGYVATVLVQTGTLRVGDAMLSGANSGKIKAMFNERGQRINEAGPSMPVIVLGLDGAPAAGEMFNIMNDEREAREFANKREQLERIQGIHSNPHITLDEIGRRIAVGNFKELNVIVKGDVDGSIEALSDSLLKLTTEEVQVNVIHKAVGGISESDVLLAVASNALIIGFQVRPSTGARKLAENEQIEIRLYSVIYDAINEVKDAMEGMLAPEVKEEITAAVEVLETFKVAKVGTIAGGMVREGKILRTSKIRVIRDGIVVYTGLLGSLKRFKDDVKEVSSGLDCGLNIENFNDIKIGDMIEAYEQVEVKRKL